MHSDRRGSTNLIAARALATYLIPGCVGRGVRLGSEGSSVGGGVGGGGVWEPIMNLSRTYREPIVNLS